MAKRLAGNAALVAIALVGAGLLACRNDVDADETRSSAAPLSASSAADAAAYLDPPVTVTTDDAGTRNGPPPECSTVPPMPSPGVWPPPPKACIDYCLGALQSDPAYSCISSALAADGPTGTLTTAQAAACGCVTLGKGNQTGVMLRTLYECNPGMSGGGITFDVSVVPGGGTAGIIATDGNAYPSCQFDLHAPTKDAPPAVVDDPVEGNRCLKCHHIKDPFLWPVVGVQPL